MTSAVRTRTHHLAELTAVGESAVRLTGRTGDAETDWLLAHKVAAVLHDRSDDRITGALPTYESVLVEFDPSRTELEATLEDLGAVLEGLDLDSPLHPESRRFRVPVLYGSCDEEDPYGPDMARVAELTGLDREEIISRHSRPTYLIRCLGAPGGSPMVYGPDLGVPVPRLRSPRVRVPQGAVSLAGRQATITPTSAPGGWCVIGRTPLRQLDLDSATLVPYRPGDTIEFVPVDEAEFRRRSGEQMTREVAS